MRRDSRRRQITTAVDRVATGDTQLSIRTNCLERIIGSVRVGNPRMVQAVQGGRSLVDIIVEHRQQEVGEFGGITRRPVVFLSQHFVHLPGPQLVDVPQLTAFGEEISRVFPAHRQVVRNRA